MARTVPAGEKHEGGTLSGWTGRSNARRAQRVLATGDGIGCEADRGSRGMSSRAGRARGKIMGPAAALGGGHEVRAPRAGPEKSSPYRPCAGPYDSFARDRGISPQPANHESNREHLVLRLSKPGGHRRPSHGGYRNRGAVPDDRRTHGRDPQVFGEFFANRLQPPLQPHAAERLQLGGFSRRKASPGGFRELVPPIRPRLRGAGPTTRSRSGARPLRRNGTPSGVRE